MARNEFYGLKKTSETTWRVQKVDADFEVTGHYDVSDINNHLECTCFASNKSTCRHRLMIDRYKSEEPFRLRIDDGHWYSFDKDSWLERIQNE